MADHTPEPWFVNGQTVGGWRIDGSGQATGLAFLANPVAIVPKREDAHRIVDHSATLARQAASIERLRAALEDLVGEQSVFAPQLPPLYSQRLEAARAALAETEAPS